MKRKTITRDEIVAHVRKTFVERKPELKNDPEELDAAVEFNMLMLESEAEGYHNGLKIGLPVGYFSGVAVTSAIVYGLVKFGDKIFK